MTSADELAYSTVTELASRIRRRDLSPVEVLEAFVERIEARNERLNAFIYTAFDEARDRAREAEQALMSGRVLGPLHGVPTAIKDLFDSKPGWPYTMGGIHCLKDNPGQFTCSFAQRVEQAGGIIVGKTNSPTMGFRGTCDNYLFGPSRNPFDPSKNTGGSSGGSAAAVADGMIPFAEGTDGGGSIRIPASWCGVYGYKASFGRISLVNRPNAFWMTNPFVFEGPLTRTVDDAALILTAVSGYDPLDPYALDEDVDFTADTSRSIEGWRIAYSPDLDVYPVDGQVAKTVEEAVRAFEEAGAVVEEVRLGIERDQMELAELWCRIIIMLSVETFENYKEYGIDLVGDHREDFPPQYMEWVDRVYEMKVPELSRDQKIRTEIYDAVQQVFQSYDLLVSPTLAALPVDNATDGNTVGPSEINGVEVNPLIGWCMTYFFNFSGHPAASVPAGMADGRYPVGMQIVGRRYADADVLAASAAFERLRPWHDTYGLIAEPAP